MNKLLIITILSISTPALAQPICKEIPGGRICASKPIQDGAETLRRMPSMTNGAMRDLVTNGPTSIIVAGTPGSNTWQEWPTTPERIRLDGTPITMPPSILPPYGGYYGGYSDNTTPIVIEGAPGPKGDTGDPGRIGARGPRGYQGAVGVAGRDGRDGQNGAQGIPGIQGVQGPMGANGAQGPQGLNGVQGTPGVNGVNGTHGTNGVNGVNGAVGPQGDVGPVGPRGPRGRRP